MTGVSINALSTDLKTGLAFLTQLPLVESNPSRGRPRPRELDLPDRRRGRGRLRRALYWLLHGLGLDAFVGAILAVAATALITGACMRTDWPTRRTASAQREPERKLDIMRDSQIGTYGAVA